MLNLFQRALFLAPSFIAIAGLTLPAFAQAPTYQGAYTYKDGLNNIYFVTGASSIGSSIKIQITGITVASEKSSDACGVLSFKFTVKTNPPTSVSINGTATDISSPTISTKKDWTCNPATRTLTPGKGPAPSATTPLIQINRTYYVFKSPNTVYLFEYTGTAHKSVKINKCRFGVLKYSAKQNVNGSSTVQAIVAGSSNTPQTVSSLPLAPGAPVCNRTGTALFPPGWIF